MHRRCSRVRRTASALAGIGLLSVTLPFSTATAADLAPNQCAVAMMWVKSSRVPNGANPYSGYSSYTFKGSTETPLASVAIVIKQRFPAAAYGAFQLYPQTYALPTVALSNPNITPDAGSVNPYTNGTPIFAPKRSYTVLLTADSVAQNTLPGALKDIPNHITWPSANAGFNLLGRSYGAKDGYDVGGTGGPLKIDWADVRTYDIATGTPIDCGNVQPARNFVQRLTPWNTKGFAGLLRAAPADFRELFPGIRSGADTWPPKPDRGLVQFFRLPANGTGLPGGVVPPPDNCANYLQARLNQRQIALFRVPQVPSYQPRNPSAGATYTQTDAGMYVYQVVGFLRSEFHPRSAYNFSLGNEDIKQDRTGGATFVVWPRNLRPAERRRVFAQARKRGWNLLEGNANSPGNLQYANAVSLRVNGPASTYTGGTYPTASRSGVPCMNGPQSVLDSYPSTASLTVVPPGTGFNSLGAEWAALPSMMGSATPQGVQCNTRQYLRGGCLRRLKQHIADTGGRFIAD
jgi:hypothetical protein